MAKPYFKTFKERNKEVVRLRNRGDTYKVLSAKFGISQERARQIVFRSGAVRSNAVYPELETATESKLLDFGFKTKEMIIDAINSGELNIGLHQWGYIRHNEVLNWLSMTPQKDNREENTINRYISYLENRGYKILKK